LNLYPTDDANYAIAILQILQQTVSVYKSRLAEAINPLYWINVVIFLPRTILEYLGAKGTGLGTKVLQLIYWICGTVLAIWKDEIFSFIRDLMSRVIS
jgi:hypothetical protein